jgi:hypothetical protein
MERNAIPNCEIHSCIKQTVREKYTMGLRSCSASDVQPYASLLTMVIVYDGRIGVDLGAEYRSRLFSHKFIYPLIFSLQMKNLRRSVSVDVLRIRCGAYLTCNPELPLSKHTLDTKPSHRFSLFLPFPASTIICLLKYISPGFNI